MRVRIFAIFFLLLSLTLMFTMKGLAASAPQVTRQGLTLNTAQGTDLSLEERAGRAAAPDDSREAVGFTENAAFALETTVRVLSSETMQPVDSARIELLQSATVEQVLVTDTAGEARLPMQAELTDEGVVALVEAEGFVRRVLRVPAVAGPVIVSLEPASTLEVRLVDESGSPLEGVEVKLLPSALDLEPWTENWRTFDVGMLGPSAGLIRTRAAGLAERGVSLRPAELKLLDVPTEAAFGAVTAVDGTRFATSARDAFDERGWTRRTDAAGVATWSGLPISEEYRWGLTEVRAMRFDPARVIVPVEYEGGDMVTSLQAPAEDVSGPFRLVEGETLRLEGQVAVRTGIVGFVPGAEPVAPSRIVAKLFHESTEAEKVQRGYGVRELEQVAWLNDDGFFQFMGVEPGRKMLRVWWQEAGRQYYFAEQIFDLPAGELLDLGNVAIDAGMPLQISLPLVDRAGLPVDAADWVEQPDEGGLVLSVDGWDGTEVEWPSFGASVLAPLGGEMTLHGLPLGHVTIELHTAEEFNLIEGTGASIDLPRQTKVWTTDTSFVELPSVLRHMVSQGIVARFPEGMQPVRGEVHVLSRSSGERHTSDLRRVAGASASEGGLMLEPGEYTVVVHTQTLEEPESGESWYGTWDGILGAGETVEVQVRRAATFEGQLVDEQGLPVAGRRLYFASGAFVEGGSQAWTHCVQTDDRGWFQLRGLEPGRTYRSARGLIVAAGGAGEITSGSLTLEARGGGANR